MTTKKQMKRLFDKIVNIGITNDLMNYDKIRIRILNSIFILILAFQLSVWLQELIQFDMKGVSILSFHILFSIILIYLSSRRLFRLASFLLNFLYPTALFGLVFVYLPPNNLEYIFVVFIFTSIIVSKKAWEKVLLTGLNLGFYLFTQTNHEFIGITGKQIDPINNFFIFLMTIGTIVIILQILLTELKRYEYENKALILKMENQNKKLSNVNEELERFTYIVSHDMKTPLRSINSFITIIERKLPKEDPEIHRYFEYVKNGTKQLHQLIMDSLEYAKLGQDEVKLETINTNELLFDLVRNFSTENVEIYTEDYPNILSNQTLVRKLFQNIIENGIKYNDSEIKLINITYELIDKNVIFKIKDNGIGIDAKYHQHVFEMYKRLNKKSRYKGTGLGLSICKKIAKQLNGDIWLESEVGMGSIFFIKLPITAIHLQN